MTVTTRAEAKRLGLRHYFTGKPCKKGHIEKRFTSIGKCMACARLDAMAQHVHTTTKRRLYSTLEGFVQAATALHEGKYSYEKAVYKGAHTLLVITCPEHGDFEQNPTNHMQGKGCPTCGAARAAMLSVKSTKQFVYEAQKVWKEHFDYSETVYLGAHKKVFFRCVTHDSVVHQSPTNHLFGRNPCPKCNHMRSAGEFEVYSYLSFLANTVSREKNILSPKELDIYLPNHGLAVEYCGVYWHSHGSVEEERKNKKNHFNKYQACRRKNVRLLTVYEPEWKERKPAIKRLLRNAIGKSKGKVMARKCELRKVSNMEARAFYDKYHPQGGTGHGEHYALFWKDKMVACMRFVYGANDRGRNAQNRTWTLGRYATRITVTGGASRLFKAFLVDHNPSEVKSFSDNRYFEGGMYSQLGFELEEELGPDYQVWSPKLGLLPKPHYQRRVLPKRIADHKKDIAFDPKTDPRTEAEITYLMGARRIYDCGKKRWVYKSPCS